MQFVFWQLTFFYLRYGRLTAAVISVGHCKVRDVVEALQIHSPPGGGSTYILRVGAPKHAIANRLPSTALIRKVSRKHSRLQWNKILNTCYFLTYRRNDYIAKWYYSKISLLTSPHFEHHFVHSDTQVYPEPCWFLKQKVPIFRNVILTTFLYIRSFFLKKMVDTYLLLGLWYPCFVLLVMSPLGFKARVGSLICTWLRHLFDVRFASGCDTCRPLDGQHGGQSLFLTCVFRSFQFWGFSVFDITSNVKLKYWLESFLENLHDFARTINEDIAKKIWIINMEQTCNVRFTLKRMCQKYK